MKRFLAIVFVLALAAVVAGCAGTPTPNSSATPAAPTALTNTPAPGTTGTPPAAPTIEQATSAPTTTGVIQLSFWHGQSQSQETALNKLVDEFNASHPSIHVTATYQGTYSDIFKKVTAAIAAGNPPDLAIAYQNDVSNYIKSGAVIPLDSLMKDPTIGFTAADLKDIYPTFIDRYPQYGNQVYSIAFMRSMEVMFYNADLLKAAGINQPPATWDEFLKDCAAVSKPPNEYCHELSPDASRFATMVWSRGGNLLSPDDKKVEFGGPAGLASLQLIDTLFKNHEAIVISKAFQDQTDFSLGKVAFTFGSTAGLPYYASAIKDAGKVKNWAIAPYPHTTPNPVVDLYGPSVTIFKTSPEKERAAFVFLKWLMGTGPDAAWVKATAYFPARQSTRNALADYIKANPLYGDALNWLQYGRTEPTTAAWNPIRGYIQDAMTAVADNKATPAQALKTAVDKANAALAGQ